MLQAADGDLCRIFRELSVVGPVDLAQITFSSGSVLYIADLFELTKAFFYQLFLQRIGNLGCIEYDEPIDIATMIAPVDPPPVNVVVELEHHKDLLGDYFAIVIENGLLKAMPNILPGYMPSFTLLPLFLVRLATEVNYEAEYDCVAGVISELASLYAILSHDSRDEEVRERLMDEVRNVVMPVMKSDFIPGRSLRNCVKSIESISKMYTIFER